VLASRTARLPWGVAAVRRVTTTLALALFLLGCGSAAPVGKSAAPSDKPSEAPQGGPVELLTGVDSCWAGGAWGSEGLLVADPEYGTRFGGKPAMWPVGYTGRRVGSEVAVVDQAGRVVATTGRRYYFSQAHVAQPENVERMESLGAVPVGDCGYAWSLIDCTAAADATPVPEMQAARCGLPQSSP